MRLKHETSGSTKRQCAWLLFLAYLFVGVSQASETHAVAPVRVEYRQATDIFNLLDNLPDWLPGYTASAYGEYWRAHLGMDSSDRAALAAYAAFRQRTAPAAQTTSAMDASAPDVFAPRLTQNVDAFAQTFLETDNFEAGVAAAIAFR